MIQINIQIPNPDSHQLEIEMEFKTSCSAIDLFIPRWRPGRYEAADFSMNFSNLEVNDINGNSLPCSQFQSNGWHVELNDAKQWSVKYTYYANKMDAGNSMISSEQVYINFVNCILHADELMNEEFTVSIEIPKSYKIACALPRNNGRAFLATSYHELVDSPLFASDRLKIMEYRVSETDFKIAFIGDHPLDDKQIVSDFIKFTQSQCEIMGGFPCDEYWFLVQSLDYKHYHGVEHQRSTVLVLGPNNSESKEEYYEKLMGVASHELFHSWNVTRIRPAEMSPYDYKNEISFDTGFAAEGFTTYYGDYFLKTSDVFSTEEYFNELNTLFKRHFDNFGRFRISLIDSSNRLWLDGYKNLSPSNKVSIYVKGALSSLILDLNIRKETNHQYALIDVVKTMYDRHTHLQGGYSWIDVKNIFEEIGGENTKLLAEKLVERKNNIEPFLKNALELVGCQLSRLPHTDRFMAFTGAKTKEESIIDLMPDSWAEKNLSIDDKILKIDGIDFNSKNGLHDGSLIDIERNGKPLTLTFHLGASLHAFDYQISINKKSSVDQVSFRKEWLNEK